MDAIQSPGLDQFRTNPFRMLRLATNVTSQQALWQGEKVLARVRVGMPLPDADPVPWLAATNELEIMDGIQTVEAPLARLVEQLLWFDFAGDPHGAALHDALTSADADKLRAYQALTADDSLANRFNNINLRLLLGFSALREVGPKVLPQAERAALKLKWKSEGNFSVVENPHALIHANTAFGGSWVGVIADAVLAWARFLSHADVQDHVRAKIAALGDDMLSADDAEVVCSAIRTRLADLVVGETKVELQRGLIENVAYLADLAGRSEIDSEIWLVAFKPLRAQFQLELAALDPAATTGAGVLPDIAAYLDRLTTLINRWKKVDTANLLGLATMIDEAVAEPLGKMRGLDLKLRRDPLFVVQLDRISSLAASASIRERVATFLEQVKRTQDSVCHFCRKRDSEREFCGAVIAENSARVSALPLPRCEQCALNHRHVYSVGRTVMWSLLIAAAAWVILTPGNFDKSNAGYGLLVLGIAIAFVGAYAARRIGSMRLTPKGERAYNDMESAPAGAQLRADGFTQLRFDSTYDSWSKIVKNGVHERDAAGPWGWPLRQTGRFFQRLLYGGGIRIVVALFILGISYCAHMH